MNQKHLRIRIEQCLSLAKASNCPRRKFGAMLLDPTRNVVLMDGYNGGPRGADGLLCAGHFCARDGLKREQFTLSQEMGGVRVTGPDQTPRFFTSNEGLDAAQAFVESQLAAYPGVKSGTHMEVGCHHGEANVICNAAASGVCTKGAMLIVTGEPCLMCAKLIHHAGITHVVLVKGGYAGGREGVLYLEKHGIMTQEVDGPQDPRIT